MLSRLFLAALLIPFGLQTPTGPDAAAEQARMDAQNAALRALLASSPRLPLTNGALPAKPQHDGWALGMVSWVASDATGLVYLLQRGDKADPVVVLERRGRSRAVVGQGHVHHAARHPARPAGQHLDDRRGELDGLQVLAQRHGC